MSADTPAQSLNGHHFHMLGVGGAGVSGLAQLASAWGAQVDGCDTHESTYLTAVRAAGIDVAIGHAEEHVDALARTHGTLVVSSAISPDQPEVARARRLGVPVMLRGELLGQLTQHTRSVVVAGAHGKTTTTAMIAHAAIACGLDPSVVIGGVMPSIDGNVRVGAAPLLIVEGDESDRTLRHLHASIAVITNVERDHHTTFASDDELVALFSRWVATLAPEALLIAGQGRLVDAVCRAATCRVQRTGSDGAGAQKLAALLQVPGLHNVANAEQAVAVLMAMGIAAPQAYASVATFTGVERRFDVVGEAGGLTVVDDYAHHPTEVAATIEAARSRWPHGSVSVVFQPHLYSRTMALANDFAAALQAADHVVMLPIYGAREQPQAGVDSRLIVNALRALDPACDVAPCNRVDATCVASTLAPKLDSSVTGCVITMGAGNVTQIARPLLAELAMRRSVDGGKERSN